jgi:selenocysteine lyase/cysteine desulfurase
MLIEGLRDIDGVILYGPQDSKRQTAVVSFNIEEMDCGGVSMLLDQKYGILCRSGLHCAPLAHRTLGTLKSENWTNRLKHSCRNNTKNYTPGRTFPCLART